MIVLKIKLVILIKLLIVLCVMEYLKDDWNIFLGGVISRYKNNEYLEKIRYKNINLYKFKKRKNISFYNL